MKRRLFPLLLLLSLNSWAQLPAKIFIRNVNTPFLILEAYSFFKSDQEFKVEKISENNFLLTYYGNKPKMLYINLRAALVSPGDSISYLYEKINSNTDRITVHGKNSQNYLFSNYFPDRMPRNYLPDYTSAKYQNNMQLLIDTLNIHYREFASEISMQLKENNCNPDLSAYLIRKIKFNLIYNLIFLEDKLDKNSSQKDVVGRSIDSAFIATDFVKIDTAYD